MMSAADCNTDERAAFISSLEHRAGVLRMSNWKGWTGPSREVISVFHIFEGLVVDGSVWQEQGRK